MDPIEFVDAYLTRLGAAKPEAPDLAGLRDLQAAHLERVPFENLSLHLGEPIDLGPEALADKILRRRRGGFCYELNGLFAQLLAALGYGVTLLGGRVWGDGAFGAPLAHLALQVEASDDPAAWLVDVGFGALSRSPIRLEAGLDQPDAAGTFNVAPAGHGDWDVRHDGVVQYRIEPHPRVLADFDAMCWYQQHSQRSHFTQSLVCTIRTRRGRVTLSGDRLIETDGADRRETHLADDVAVLDAYHRSFGIDLDRVPRLVRDHG